MPGSPQSFTLSPAPDGNTVLGNEFRGLPGPARTTSFRKIFHQPFIGFQLGFGTIEKLLSLLRSIRNDNDELFSGSGNTPERQNKLTESRFSVTAWSG